MVLNIIENLSKYLDCFLFVWSGHVYSMLFFCRLLLAELQTHQDAWPFMTPVNPKSVPGYRKVIKKPMDFSTIQEKLSNSQYVSLHKQHFHISKCENEFTCDGLGKTFIL